ncbi:ATP-binding protein [Methanolobus profundi]|uniref:histidine kinase n=1 Tax=Methanolobus profundi TaxID=487685 RepID=A0A1I4PJ74_9EURY|nr:ATP-binding protein [Methanolobus profundi]SFM27757.1 PAS domain S-box-containing protein [Methanolobus profundi]
MKNKVKSKLSLVSILFFAILAIIFLHIYTSPDARRPECIFFLVVLTGFILMHTLMVKSLKKELETEVKKNEISHENLLLKYRVESTLSQISSLLAFSDDLDEKINGSLKLLGNMCNADRAYVFRFQTNNDLVDNTHEWCADGVGSQKDHLQDLPRSMYKWWTDKLYNDEIIHIKDLDELPAEAEPEKELLAGQAIRSLIVLPFKIEGELAGFIGFDNIQDTGGWDESDIEALRTFSNMLGLAFRKKAVAEELDVERQQLLSVFDSIDDPIYVSDPHNHEILYVNKFMSKILEKDVVGRKCYEIMQGAEEPCDFCTNPIILENRNKAYKWEYHNPIASRDYLISDRIIKWPDGRDARLEIAHDITEIKEKERELKKNEENFKKLIDSSPLPIAIMDSEGSFEYINNKLTEMLGYTIEDIPTIDEWWMNAYPDPASRKIVKDNWTNVFRTKDTGLSGEWNLTCRDGTLRQVAFYFTKTENGVIFILNDLTELKRAEEALLLDESCLETLHELSQMNILEIDEIKSFALEECMKLTESSAGFLGFFDEENNRLTTDVSPADLLSANDINEEIFLSLLENTSMWPKFYQGKKTVVIHGPMEDIYSSDRAFFWKLSIGSFLAVPILNEDDVVGFAAMANKEREYTVSDARQLAIITQMVAGMILLKRSEDELKKYNQKLREINTELSRANDELHSLDEMKNNFLSTISHELKTPLISIMGFSELVGDEILGPLNNEQKRAMNVVNSNSTQLKRLIESLLFMSSLGAKNFSYDFSTIPIKPIIENSLSVIAMENKDKMLTVNTDLPDELYFISGDPNYLSELFIHLLDNAFKFTQSNGRIDIRGHNEGNSIHVVIEDTGIGIPETKILRTFDSFYQLDGSLTRRYGGAGIGLNICKRIAEDHGGTLWIESVEGVGTKVHVKLPAKKKTPRSNPSGSS